MKRILSFCLCAVCFSGLSLAQNTEDIIRENPRKAACSFYVYDYKNAPEMTPAPEGYEPFYISHFARHGARYCTSEYGRLYEWLTKASAAGKLSAEGQEFLKRYEVFYEKVKFCSGNLTGVGKSQHKAIAEHMYQRFPSVFEGPTHIEAVSTESPRVIMSMWSCLSRLVALDEDLDVDADASIKYASWLQPSLTSQPYYMKEGFKFGETAEKDIKEYYENTVPWREIAEKFFTSAEVLTDFLKVTPERFIGSLHGVVTGTYCLDEDQGCFDDVFTAEQLYQVWKGQSARYFLDVANYGASEGCVLDYAAFTLDHMITMAEEDMASGKTQLRLRFGHDSGIAPLIAVMNLNGYGKDAATFEEGLDIFPSYNVPMGASVQLIFFKNAEGDILVKALLNEQEATLPFESAYGPYYKWEDFKGYYKTIIDASKAKIQKMISDKAALAALNTVDWG